MGNIHGVWLFKAEWISGSGNGETMSGLLLELRLLNITSRCPAATAPALSKMIATWRQLLTVDVCEL